MKKKLYDKLISLLFAGFITLTLFLSIVFNRNDIMGSLYESKDALFSFRISDDYVKEVISVLDTAFDTAIFFRVQYIDLYGDIQRACNKKVFWESDMLKTILVGSDNKLYSVGNIMSGFKPNNIDKAKIDDYGEAVKELAKYVKEKDSDLIFFFSTCEV